ARLAASRSPGGLSSHALRRSSFPGPRRCRPSTAASTQGRSATPASMATPSGRLPSGRRSPRPARSPSQRAGHRRRLRPRGAVRGDLLQGPGGAPRLAPSADDDLMRKRSPDGSAQTALPPMPLLHEVPVPGGGPGPLLVNDDCLGALGRLAPRSIDVVVTSPPYNLGIRYAGYDDDAPRGEYLAWTDAWLGQGARVR